MFACLYNTVNSAAAPVSADGAAGDVDMVKFRAKTPREPQISLGETPRGARGNLSST
jgi:hypothetical protein